MGIRIQVENFGDKVRSIRYSSVEKKYTYAMHMHQFIEVFILLEGELEITVGERTELMKAGQCAMIFSYQSHKYYSKMLNKARIILFSQAIIPDFYKTVRGMTADKCVFTPETSTMNFLKNHIFDKENLSIYDMKGGLYFLLGDFLKQCTLTPTSTKALLPDSIINYITEHMNEDITLEILAKRLGYTPQYLSGIINRIFDMNFSKVVACVRVEKARRLLRESEKSRAEICYECGFGSERSFHRQFKEITTLTPEKYRTIFLGKGADEILFLEDAED